MKKNCWISICCFLVLSLLLTGCDGTQKTDNVDMVKQGYLGLYTDMTVQQLLHRHYGMLYQEETWNGGTTNKGEDLVEVRYTDLSGTFEDTRIQFKTDGTCFWVSAFSDPMEPIEESTDLMATLNYLYLEAYLQENYEQSQDEAFLQELIQKLDQIPASAVLYGAAAGYTGDRAQICRVFGEEPIDLSAAWLLDSQGLLDLGAYAADDTLDPYTADELLQELSSNALRAQKTFLNQYIELTGKITSFDSSGAYFVLGPTGDTYYATPITCIISDETLLDTILEANIGDVATIRCQVTDVGEFLGYSVNILEITALSPSGIQNNPSEIVGAYTFGNEYTVRITEEDPAYTDGGYWFCVSFDSGGSDYVAGELNIGEIYRFDGYSANDVGELIFTIEDGKLFLEFSSERHNWFKEELIKLQEIDYSNQNLSQYCGLYYSPTGMYTISLSEGLTSGTFFLELLYKTGVYDFGTVTPGEETHLENGAYITVDILENGTVHVLLYSAISADGNFDENLIQ